LRSEETVKGLRSLLLFVVGLLGSVAAVAGAPPPALPSDSIYQLQASLADQSGRPQSWRALRGKPRIVTMFYSSCPYMCPLIVESGKSVDRALTPAERARLGFVLVSMDPARDSPAALMALAQKRGIDTKRWLLLRPAAKDVRPIAGVLGVRYRALADGEFNHTSVLVLLDAEGRTLARTETIGSKPDPEFLKAVRAALAPRKS
jgi:protein SCO1/2